MARSNAAGGINSKNVTRQGVRTGKPREAAHVAGVAQRLGSKVGDHATRAGGEGRGDLNYRGEPLFAGKAFNTGVALGNAKALDVGKGGPGAGRTIHKSGSQQSGAARDMPRGTDILNQFGPDSAAVNKR